MFYAALFKNHFSAKLRAKRISCARRITLDLDRIAYSLLHFWI